MISARAGPVSALRAFGAGAAMAGWWLLADEDLALGMPVALAGSCAWIAAGLMMRLPSLWLLNGFFAAMQARWIVERVLL